MESEMADTTEQLFERWRKQWEEGAQAWARLFAQTPVTPEVLNQWKQVLDQSIEAWSRVLGQAMQTEGFAQWLGRYLEQWLNAYGPVKKAADQSLDAALATMNLASRGQLTAVARQLVELDERVERVEDGVHAILMKLDELARRVGRREGVAETAAPRDRG
jgi:hypothetical protein